MTSHARPSSPQASAERARHVAEIPKYFGAKCPSAPALVFQDRWTSFGELDQRSSQVANGLLGAGLERGARIAILAEDSDEVFELLFGIAKANCVMTGINWRLTAPEVRFILEDGDVEALFIDAARLELMRPVLEQMPDIGLIVCIGAGDSTPIPSFSSWRETQSDTDPDLPCDPEDVYAQLYTSGTTGNPKGVRLAHRSFFAVVAAMAAVGDEWIGWSQDDVALSCFPSFHIGGLWWIMTALSAGASLVIMPHFEPNSLHGLVPRYKVTKVCMVPAMIQMTLAEPGAESVDWSSLTHLVYGGAPIPKVFLERSNQVIGCGLVQIYGLTETGNTAICLRPADHLRDELLSAAGRPYPGVELKVIAPDDSIVDAGVIGEVCLRSPANMVEYWKMPEATAATLRGGWIHTGDAGYVNDEGYLFICDRIKDMILSAGENIYPAEIESVLSRFPGVAEAAVLGIPDERWGEQVLAILVRSKDEAGEGLRKRALLAHCRIALADFKVPTRIEFRDALPRTPSGKIKKAELRAPFWADQKRQV